MLAPVEEQVPPKKYGGTELVVHNLTELLMEMGHDVTLFATGDSQTNAKLVPIFPQAIRTLLKATDYNVRQTLTLIGIGKMLKYICDNEFDLVHNHVGWKLLPFVNIIDVPIVTTLHGNLSQTSEREVYSVYPDLNYISISMNQRKDETRKMNFIGNVYNGIALEKFNFFAKAKDYFAFFARICHEKGALQAIEIAKKAGVKLVMAGKIDPVDSEYFEEKIKPLIDNKQITFIGEIGHEEKVQLLGNAKALIAPIQWEEPFGLYFIESMICGTPVIANNRGSVSEIIINNKTGFIVNTIEEAAKKVNEIEKINRYDCHMHVTRNFSAEKMAKEYLQIYQKIIKKNRHG